jgi:hypothetical protein
MLFQVLAFRGISPQAPVHIIIIPKVKDGLSRLSKVLIFVLPFFSIQWILLCQFDIINSVYEYYIPCTLMTTSVKEGKLENSINLSNALDDD